MNWKKILGIIAGITVIAMVVMKLKSNKEITEDKVYQFDKNEALHVSIETIQLKSLHTEDFFSGTFEPNKETKVSAEIQGKINTILVDVGSVVSKGQTLILLDNSLLKLQLQAIEVQLEGLQADVNRFTILANADAIQGVQLEKAELGLKSAKIQKATLLEQIQKTKIKAPFNGVVTAKFSEEGAFAAPGIPLLQITDISELKFTINVSENDLRKFKLNQNYSISADAYPTEFLKSKTLVIGSKANMGSSFSVQFKVKNTSNLKIKAGMFGNVKLDNKSSEKGIVIPSSSIVGTEDQAQVYVVKNGKARLQNIVVLRKIKSKSIISSGLKEGDKLITNGFITLFDGATIVLN